MYIQAYTGRMNISNAILLGVELIHWICMMLTFNFAKLRLLLPGEYKGNLIIRVILKK